MNKIPRSKTFLQIAEVFAERSTCLRGQVGAIIIKDNHIIAHGYNGAPSGQPECLEVGCQLYCACGAEADENGTILHNYDCGREIGCKRTLHGEENAVLYAARVGVSCQGATIYSTHEPCRQCAKMIATAGIESVVWLKPYRLGAADYLFELGVQIEHFEHYRRTPTMTEQP